MNKLCEINNVDHVDAIRELNELIPEFFQRPNCDPSVSVLNNNLSDSDEESDEENDDERDEENCRKKGAISVLLFDERDFSETTAELQFEHVKYVKMNKMCYCSVCILKYISGNDERKQRFSNIYKLYAYICTIPSTQVKCERDFSLLKRTKTRLRANLNDESLENLIFIASESKLFDQIDFDSIVDYIISKSPKISLYLNT